MGWTFLLGFEYHWQVLLLLSRLHFSPFHPKKKEDHLYIPIITWCFTSLSNYLNHINPSPAETGYVLPLQTV